MTNFRLNSKFLNFLDSEKSKTTQKIKLKDFSGSKHQIDNRISSPGFGKNQLYPKTMFPLSPNFFQIFNPIHVDLPEFISTSKLCHQTISSLTPENSNPSLPREKAPHDGKFTEIFDFGPEAHLYSGISNLPIDPSSLASEEAFCDSDACACSPIYDHEINTGDLGTSHEVLDSTKISLTPSTPSDLPFSKSVNSNSLMPSTPPSVVLDSLSFLSLDDYECDGEISVLLRRNSHLMSNRTKIRPTLVRRRLISKISVWRNQEWRLISYYAKTGVEWDPAPDDNEWEDIKGGLGALSSLLDQHHGKSLNPGAFPFYPSTPTTTTSTSTISYSDPVLYECGEITVPRCYTGQCHRIASHMFMQRHHTEKLKP